MTCTLYIDPHNYAIINTSHGSCYITQPLIDQSWHWLACDLRTISLAQHPSVIVTTATRSLQCDTWYTYHMSSNPGDRKPDIFNGFIRWCHKETSKVALNFVWNLIITSITCSVVHYSSTLWNKAQVSGEAACFIVLKFMFWQISFAQLFWSPI